MARSSNHRLVPRIARRQPARRISSRDPQQWKRSCDIAGRPCPVSGDPVRVKVGPITKTFVIIDGVLIFVALIHYIWENIL